MFIFWDGYEIDGSDTDFDIILPERIQEKEFIDYFLSIPLFDKKTMRIDYYDNELKKNINIGVGEECLDFTNSEPFKNYLEGKKINITIDISCNNIELLPENIKKELYDLTARRKPKEKKAIEAENPCMSTNKTVGEISLILDRSPFEYIENSYNVNSYQFKDSLKDCCDFALRIQVGFIYEYAMYILDYLVDSFPSISITGGLDCAGGWTDGCTYSSSLYAFEKIQIPVKYNIKNTIKRLKDYDILYCFSTVYAKSYRDFKKLDSFILSNLPAVKTANGLFKQPEFSLIEYADIVQNALNEDTSYFENINKTSIKVLFSTPENYKDYPKIKKRLEDKLGDFNIDDKRHSLIGYLSFYKEGNKEFIELRVQKLIKPYVLELLSLIDSNEIESIKEKTYNRRKQND